jgi:hypothetical protein
VVSIVDSACSVWNDRGTSAYRIRLLTLGVALLLAVTFAAGASATTTSPAGGSAFCQKAHLIFGNGTSLLSLPPATIKADDAVFKANQPAVLSLAPSSIKPDLKQIFAFDNGLFGDLSKSDWTVAKLPPAVLRSLGVSGPKLKPASDKVIGYLDATCGFKLPKP